MPIKPVSDERINIGDISLHYVQWGEQGTPLVFAHGLTGNAFCFQALADELAGDHRVFAYDLRGRGDSDKPTQDYSVPTHAADLARLLNKLELNRPVVVGHSLGAFIALYFAAHYPEQLSKLVLIDGGTPPPWKTPDKQPMWLTTSISRLGTPVPSFEAYVQRLKALPHLGPYWNEYLDLYFEHDVRHWPDGSVSSKCYREGVLEEQQRVEEALPEQQWTRVQVPTLLLRAGMGMFSDNDQLLPEEAAAAVQRSIKSCRFVDFPTLNHYTIIFGVEYGPAQEIRAFVDEN